MSTPKIKVNTFTMEIMAGPNAATLFDALRYAFDKKSHIECGFCVPAAYTTIGPGSNQGYIPEQVTISEISSIEHIDRTGIYLKIKGRCRTSLFDKNGKEYKFEAKYSTQIRKGQLTLFP